MSQSLDSRDVRWLLPAFLYLTPGLDRFSFEPRPEHLAVLGEQDVLLQAQHPQTGQDVFVFGEAGRTMGVEFYRTWMMAVGFEAAVLSPEGDRAVHRAFLAPTALANHLIRLEFDGGGGCVANHQALTLAELEYRLGELLETALAAGAAAPQPPAPVPLTSQPPEPPGGLAGRFCSQCGAQAGPTARFCRSCGASLEDA